MLIPGVALVLPGGCSDLDLPAIRYETEHLLVGTYFEEEVCAGSLSELDAHVQYLTDQLEIDLDEPVEFYWVEAGEPPPVCPSGSGGCFDPEHELVVTHWSTARHELGHAVAWQAAGGATADEFFSEGVAEGFVGRRTMFGWQAPSLAVGAESASQVDYASAANFMRWLHGREGAADLRELLDRSSRKRGPGHQERVFEKTYGTSLSAMEEEYWATAPDVLPADTFCSFPSLGSITSGFDALVELDCSEEHTRGVKRLERSYAFDVDVAGPYVLELESPGEILPWFCYSQPVALGEPLPVINPPVRDPGDSSLAGEPPDDWWLAAGRIELFLSVGRYRIDARLPDNASGSFRFRAHPLMSPAPWPGTPEDSQQSQAPQVK